MKRKNIKQLTIDEVAEIIKNAILEAVNEMDGATYAKLYNASRRAKVDNQNGIYIKSYNINQVEKDTNGETIKTPIRTKTVFNDDIILRAQKMQEPVQQHWLSKYIGKTFKFYGEDRLGLTANILLKFQSRNKCLCLLYPITFLFALLFGILYMYQFHGVCPRNRLLTHCVDFFK